jgi:uncharacterized membrane protein
MSQILFSRINLALWSALAVLTLAGYLMVPSGIHLPIHWGPSGQPDAFWPRNWALAAVPAFVLGQTLFFAVVGRFMAADQFAASRNVTAVIVPALSALMLVIQGTTVAIGLGYPDVMIRVIALAVGVLMILVGNVLPKTRPNAVAGLRFPSIPQDPAGWRATQRLTGLLLIVGGEVIILGALLIGSPRWLIAVLIASVLVPVVIGTVYGLRLARRTGHSV